MNGSKVTHSNKGLAEIAARMRDIDIAMLSTHTEGGAIAGRPMSNNRDVDYDGSSYYFTWGGARMLAEIRANPQVALSFHGSRHFLVAVEGTARLTTDKTEMSAHWQPELDEWFEQGVETPGVTMIHVRATRLHYWDGLDSGEIVLADKEGNSGDGDSKTRAA